MVRSADFPRIGWNTVFSSQNIRRGGKDVLEAVFAVKVEAGDGMQQPSLSERSERTLYSCQLRFPIYIFRIS